MRGGDVENHKSTLRRYAGALERLPVAEVLTVIRLFQIGDLGDGYWRPKPAELRQATLMRMERAAKEARREMDRAAWAEEKRLMAEKIASRTPESRERVAEMLAHFKAAAPPDDRPPSQREMTAAEANDWLESQRLLADAGHLEKITISAALRDKLGLPRETVQTEPPP